MKQTTDATTTNDIDLSLADRLTILDEQAEWSNFSDQTKQGSWISKVSIQGIQCATCGINIENTLSKMPGIFSVKVNTGVCQATVVWDPVYIKPSNWLLEIHKLGYFALPAGDSLHSQIRKQELRQALWRFLVAAFCMMQVMMFSYPLYMAAPGEMTDDIVVLLRWGLWVISVPVLLFSCRPFFSSAWRALLKGRVNMDLPASLGMLLTFLVSTAGTFDPQGVFGKEVFFDSFTMFVFFLLGGRWLELKLKDKTFGAIEVIINRLPDSSLLVQSNGDVKRVPSNKLKINDCIQVLPGEVFPVDGIILEGNTLVDEAMLTGESIAIKKNTSDQILAGTVNLESKILIQVYKTGTDTKFAEIVRLMEDAANTKPQLVQFIDRMAVPFLIFVIIAALFSMAWWWQIDPARALMIGATVLIVTCPCALSLATPAALLASAGTLARSGVLIKNLVALEVLEKINTVIFDKTGTLTEDGLILKRITTRDSVNEQTALELAALIAQQSLHPVARAFNQHSVSKNYQLIESKEMLGQGILATVKKDDCVVQYKFGSTKFCELTSKKDGRVHLSDENGWLASFEIEEKLRKETAHTIKRLQKNNIDVILLSGDTQAAVDEFSKHFSFKSAVGNSTPESKLAYLNSLQNEGYTVAMVGDGMNDGPVLAAAQASFAFGTQVPLTQAKADFVVLTKNLERIPESIELSKKMMFVIKQNLLWAFLYNLVSIPLAMFGYLPAWLAGLGMALSSLLVIANAARLYVPFGHGAK